MAQFNSKIKRLAVFTSGGDAPGMNAAIRAVVRNSIFHKIEVVGISYGYKGFLDKKFQQLELSSVANILQRGGTILKTGRCHEFLKAEIRRQATQNIREAEIDGIVCIGGDGSFKGALALWQEHQLPIVGVPGTIDNDIWGTDLSIGYDTAVNTALDSIDRIRDTAASHDRLFIVEVMGRNSGYIAIDVAVAGGAEEVFIPESPITVDQAVEHIQKGISRGKTSSILITAEGQKSGRAYDLAESIRKKSGFEAKVCILGHVQRGGSPTAQDRILASRMGAQAVESLLQGICNVMVGIQGKELVHVGLEQAVTQKKPVPNEMIRLAQVLSI